MNPEHDPSAIHKALHGPHRELTEEDERDAIARAASGETEAIKVLLAAYSPLILGAICAHRDNGGMLDEAELEAVAVESVVDSCRAFDPSRAQRLARLLKSAIRKDLCDAELTDSTIPRTTKWRVQRVKEQVREEGDTEEDIYQKARAAIAAGDLPPNVQITDETFTAAYAMWFPFESIDALTDRERDNYGDYTGDAWQIEAQPLWSPIEPAPLDRAVMAHQALRALTDPYTQELVRLRFGFVDTVPDFDSTGDLYAWLALAQETGDAEALAAVPVVLSRPLPTLRTIHNRLDRALDIMRAALDTTDITTQGAA